MIVPGCTGSVVKDTLNVLAVPEPQLLLAVTEMLPLLAATVAVMELVVEVPVQPDGKVQVYEVAPFTVTTLYVLDVDEQILVSPLIVPGVPGIEFTVTANVFAADEPQELFAFTEMFPPVDPAVAIIVSVVEVPDQPEGKVHV